MIRIYTEKEIEGIEVSGKILAKCLSIIAKEAKIGVSLKELDNLAFKLLKDEGAKAAFFGYQPGGADHPYMAAICTSLNEVVVHGFPTDYKLQSGDVLKIDFGVKYKGFFSDSALTVGIGEISSEAKRLINGTKETLQVAIKSIKPEITLGDLGFVISETAKKNKLTVIKDLGGHGIGYELHEDPFISNFGRPGAGIKLKPGMVLAIEPMLSLGRGDIYQREDESWALKDESLSAQFEHTIVITNKGSKILTK